MTAKEFFSQIKYLNDIIRVKTNSLKELESVIEYSSPIISDMPSARKDPATKRTDALVNLISRKEELTELINKDLKTKSDATQMIESLSDPTEKWVMYSRYFEAMTWKEIIDRSGYSSSRIYELHGMALKSIRDRFGFERSKSE